jgi:uncharacterized membrane protein SpoIIM required for sporulation
MKTFVFLLLIVGILLSVVPLLQIVSAQTTFLGQMMDHMRFTHSQMAEDIDVIKQLMKTNHTREALTLLDGMDIKIDHMNTMFNDLVWELSNRGH